jgi:hypothetical protein
MAGSWQDQGKPQDLAEMAVLAAAREGDIATFSALRRTVRFVIELEGIAILKERFSWSATAVLMLHILLSIERDTPDGVEMTLDLERFLEPGGFFSLAAKSRV